MIIAGERSGVGKTTITLAILAYLISRGDRVQSFKVGPDYIDPMFHTHFTGRPCRNLDPVLTSEDYVKTCFAQHCQNVDYALIEGVMGLFDGIQLSDTQFPDYASTAHIARILGLPLLLVIDCSRLSTSVAAIVRGYQSLDKNLHLAGVILNRVGSDRHLQLLQTALESINMPIVGVLRRQDSLTIPDRHLGLVPRDELGEIRQLQDQLASIAQNCFNWDILLPLLTISPQENPKNPTGENKLFPPIRIGIARDKAFNFYYPDKHEHFAQIWEPIGSIYQLIFEYGLDVTWELFHGVMTELVHTGEDFPANKITVPYPPRPSEFNVSQSDIATWAKANDHDGSYPFYPSKDSDDWKNHQLKYVYPPSPYIPLSSF